MLNLRFFQENILGDVASNTENLNPTTSASGIVLKFDGIGNSEDLMMVLNLIDKDGADNILGNGDDNLETTRAIRIDNTDIIKGNANVPAPYNAEFTLDQQRRPRHHRGQRLQHWHREFPDTRCPDHAVGQRVDRERH